MTALRTATLLSVALVALSACHKKKPETAAPPAPAVNPVRETATNNDGDRDRAERERLERERLEREKRLAEMRRTMAEPIYFGFDRSDLTPEARQSLEAKWTILRANPSMRITIEGNADDLGSDEYNLALGQRRAAAAKRFLTQREIDPDRVEIASFGEERPTCQAATDDCRATNRRDEFRVTAGEPVVSER
jgi:peptidoglycan-associated lipoprotein